MRMQSGKTITSVAGGLILLMSAAAIAQRADQQPGRRPVAEQDRHAPMVHAEQRQGRRPIETPDVEIVRDVVYATIDAGDREPIDLMMDVAFLKDHDNQIMPAVVLIHGGGYYAGSKHRFDDLLAPLARGGYLVATIDYRLSGVAPYPAAVHDCKAAVRFIRTHAEELGVDPQRIGVLGHSAGGHLAALLAVTGNVDSMSGEVGETGVSSRVRCAVDLSGPVDYTMEQRDHPAYQRIFDEWFAGPADSFDQRITEASVPMHIDSEDPPVLIVHGTADRAVSVDHPRRFRDLLAEHGIEHEYLELEGVGHDVARPETAQAIAAFLDRHLGGSSVESMRTYVPGGRTATGASRRPIPNETINPPGRGSMMRSGKSNDDAPADPQPEPDGSERKDESR